MGIQLVAVATRSRSVFPAGRRPELYRQLVRLHVDADHMRADEVSIR